MRTIIAILFVLLLPLMADRAITLAWDKNPETDIVGYRVNYDTNPAKLEKSLSVAGDVAETTVTLPLGEYWFELRAINLAKQESQPSRTILGVVREPENLGWLDRQDWKLTASSEDQAPWALSLATDDDLASFWHTKYQPENIPPPHWIQVELPELANIFALYAMPRSDGYKISNITAYEVQSSLDGKTWKPWAKGEWTDTPDLKKATLPVRNTRFVRLVSNGVQASIADLNLLGYYGPPEAITPPAPTKPPLAPGKLRVVKIETSVNLTEWETLAFVPLIADSAARFIRTEITTIKP